MKSRVLFFILFFLSSQICSGHPGNLKPDSRIDFYDYALFADDWANVSDVNENACVDWISIQDVNGHQDRIYTVEIDSNDFVYINSVIESVTNKSINVLRKYSPDSNEPLWSLENDYYGVTFDMNDYVYIGGSSIRKIDPNGSIIWSINYDSKSWDAVCVDSNMNVYAASTDNSSYPYTYTFAKFFPDNNNPDWTTSGSGYFCDIVIDSNDDIYVLDEDHLTKFSHNSNQPIWQYSYSGGRMWEITMDPNENIITTGKNGNVVVTVKHSPSSDVPLWTKQYGVTDTQCWPEAIVTDANSNIYICGCAIYSGNWDFITIKYEPNGTESWVDRYDWAAYDCTKDIEVDSDGNIYVTGDTAHSEGLEDSFTTLKYNSEGGIVWKAQYYGPGSGRIVYEMESTAIDSKNNVYVGGSVGDDGGWISDSQDYALVKYEQIKCSEKLQGDFDQNCIVDYNDLVVITSDWLKEI